MKKCRENIINQGMINKKLIHLNKLPRSNQFIVEIIVQKKEKKKEQQY